MVENPAMEIVTVGTGSCVPTLERSSSSVLIKGAGQVAVVDLGLGALHGLLRCGVSHTDVDAVLFTHLHIDHSCELLPLLFAANYDERPRTKPLTLIGREGLGEFLDKLTEAYGRWIEPHNYERTVVELAPGEAAALGDLRVRAGDVVHASSSLALRVECGSKSVVITGDTGPSPEVEALSRGAGLLICEAALAEGKEATYHLNARQAGELAQGAGVERLALTHFYPSSDASADFDPAAAAAETFSGPVVAAFDGMKFFL
jgi:ribonuclease BN (tRNA processing enzyme)